MSTHCRIGIEESDGRVTYAYCHHDGYPGYAGRRLLEMGRRETRAMLMQGDMSSIGEPFVGGSARRPRVAKDVESFVRSMASDGARYAYLLKRTGTWVYASYPDVVLNPLRAAVAQIPTKR